MRVSKKSKQIVISTKYEENPAGLIEDKSYKYVRQIKDFSSFLLEMTISQRFLIELPYKLSSSYYYSHINSQKVTVFIKLQLQAIRKLYFLAAIIQFPVNDEMLRVVVIHVRQYFRWYHTVR